MQRKTITKSLGQQDHLTNLFVSSLFNFYVSDKNKNKKKIMNFFLLLIELTNTRYNISSIHSINGEQKKNKNQVKENTISCYLAEHKKDRRDVQCRIKERTKTRCNHTRR